MSIPALLVEIQRDTCFSAKEINSDSEHKAKVKVQNEDNLPLFDSSTASSIVSLLLMIQLYLQQHTARMRDKWNDTAAMLSERGLKGSVDALDKKKQSAHTELSAKQTVLWGQIFGGMAPMICAALGFTAISKGYFAGPNTHGESALAITSLASGSGTGISHIITSVTENVQAQKFTDAKIGDALADQMRQWMGIIGAGESWQKDQGGQMSGQYQKINSDMIEILRAFNRVFDVPITA